MENFFKLEESHTETKTEILAGVTSFMTMAYILAVNPIILSDAGMDAGGVFTATALSAMIATLVMALFANYPFGLDSFFAYTVGFGDMQKSWHYSLTAILIE